MVDSNYHVVGELEAEPRPSSDSSSSYSPSSFRPRWLRPNKLSKLPSLFCLPSTHSLRATKCGRMFLLIAALFVGGFFHYMWKAEAAMNEPWVPEPGSILFGQRPLPSPIEEKLLLGDNYVLPLRTRGRDIVDQRGRRFKLSSVNWYGASDELFVPGGLDVQHRDTIAATVKKLGFNSVRLPYSDEMVARNPRVPRGLLAANPDLVGLRALDVFDAVVEALTDAGLAVVVNNHITTATWCCGADPCDAGWSNDHLPGPMCRVRQTEEEWIGHWETVMSRLRHNPRVVGADLRNEVRGVWGTMPWDRWAAAAERAGNRLLALNPDWLVVVGGTESGNDLSGVGGRPVELEVAHRVVYSAHVYAWSGWGSLEGRFAKRTYPSFVRAMRRNWAYLVEGDVAPVWIGEFGAPHAPSTGDNNYWSNLMRYLKAIDADFGYWAINPRKPKDNEKESYSLVQDDWVTPVLDYRMKDMVELIRQ
jgi:endoglucanase